jgi:hypothetical protein
MDLNRSARLESLCSLFCEFVRPPKSLRASAERAAKVPPEMRLVGKASFRRDILDRALFLSGQQLPRLSKSATQELPVRRSPTIS